MNTRTENALLTASCPRKAANQSLSHLSLYNQDILPAFAPFYDCCETKILAEHCSLRIMNFLVKRTAHVRVAAAGGLLGNMVGIGVQIVLCTDPLWLSRVESNRRTQQLNWGWKPECLLNDYIPKISRSKEGLATAITNSPHALIRTPAFSNPQSRQALECHETAHGCLCYIFHQSYTDSIREHVHESILLTFGPKISCSSFWTRGTSIN